MSSKEILLRSCKYLLRVVSVMTGKTHHLKRHNLLRFEILPATGRGLFGPDPGHKVRVNGLI